MHALCQRVSISIAIFLLFIPFPVTAQKTELFKDILIEPSFHEILREDPGFMGKGGARLFVDESGRRILIGIGKVQTKGDQQTNEQPARRAGEIKARAAILELVGDVELTTIKGKDGRQILKGEKMSLSSFFQVTESSVRERIKLLPVIGSWRSYDGGILHIAVGKTIDGTADETRVTGTENSEAPVNISFISGEEPFISILRASPFLCRNGGARGFLMDDGQRMLIAVASTTYKGSFAKAKRTAQLLAIRNILNRREGIDLSSVKSLTDSEQMRLSEKGEEKISLSRFTSIQEEKVTGMVNALPVVATWRSEERNLFYLALGKVFEK